MTRIFTDGAEFQDILFWSSQGSTSAVASQYRGGGASYLIAAWARKDFTAISELYLRFAVRADVTNGAILKFHRDGTVIARLDVDNTSKLLKAYTGDASTLLATGVTPLNTLTWYLIEVHYKVDDSAGIFHVRLDGIEQINFTGDTKPGTDSDINGFTLWSCGGAWTYYDDLALNDTNGSFDNSWCGDGRIDKIYPNDAGTTNSWLNSGSVSGSANYLYVDEFPSDTSTYAYASASSTGAQDQYNLTSMSGAGKTITRIYAEARGLKTRADTTNVKLGYLPSGGTDQMSGSIALTTGYTQILGTSASTNPVTGVAWTETDLNSLEFVVEMG